MAETPRTILVVDDLLGMRRELRAVLGAKGYRIVEAASGKETLEVVAREPVDLVLMDGVMEEMDGFEACARLKQNPDTTDIPVLMVTSLEDSDSINRAFDAGAEDYITKPVNYTVLEHRLEKIFINRAQELQIAQQQENLKSLLQVATMENSYKCNILETMTDGLLVVDTGGEIETANRAAHFILQYTSKGGLLGVNLEALCTDKSDFCKNQVKDDYTCTNWTHLKKSALKNSLSEIRTYMRKADGDALPVVISGSTLKKAANEPPSFIFSFKDMTAQKKADTALWQAKTDIESANKKLAQLNDTLMEERAIIENIVLKTHTSPLFDAANLRILEKPAEKTTGDIVCSTDCGDNFRRVLLGDFTGHGLTAAVGSPLISEIFYSNTSMEMPVAEMFSILNQRLLQALNEDMFMACSCIELDGNAMRLQMFNAGLANIIIFRHDKIIHMEPSSFVPRGLMDVPDQKCNSFAVEKNDRIIMYTDGFEEATDPQGQMFGEKRFYQLLERTLAEDRPLEHLLDEVMAFRQQNRLEDDITLVELTC